MRTLHPLLSLFFTFLVQDQAAFKVHLQSPFLPQPNNSLDEFTPVFLGRDESSGCICREQPEKYVICFGRESCKKFPKDVDVDPKELRIRTTGIIKLEKGDLDNMGHLVTLEVEGNEELKELESGVFLGMEELRNLSISFNKALVNLEKDVFDGLVALSHLYLVGNGFKSFIDIAVAFSPKYLPQLYKLGLSENVFENIGARDLMDMNGSTLVEFDLSLCQIQYIHPDALNPLENLRILRIGENPLNETAIAHVIKNKSITTLDLYRMGLSFQSPKRIFGPTGNSNIINLSLAGNQLEVIKNVTFPLMSNLETLDLRGTLLRTVTKEAFYAFPNLKTLLLSGNKLSSIPRGILLKQLTSLDLSYNSGDSYMSLGKMMFSNMTNLNFLNLSFNKVNVLTNTTFVGLTNLLVLDLKNATLFRISNGSFSQLKNLVFLNLESNLFGLVHGVTEGMFNGLENLEVLMLGGCGIKSLNETHSPFKALNKLKYLGLQRNKFLKFSGDFFFGLQDLVTLDISDNTLYNWRERLFTTNEKLRNVIATRNKFTQFTEEMLFDFVKLSSLEIDDNPFNCECSNYNSSLWNDTGFQATIQLLLENEEAFCVFPEQTTNFTVAEFLLNNCEINNGNNIYMVVFLPIAVTISILLIVCFILYYFRWHIRYWLFIIRLNIARTGNLHVSPGASTISSTDPFLYDAFVSYCNSDRNFVVRLVAMLENYEPFLKLCVYERDFEPGSIISESVLQGVAASRRTLLVVSDAFAKSQWCRWEAQIAENQRIFLADEKGQYVGDSLVIIKLGPVSDKHITPMLRYLLKTRLYLEWDADPKKQTVFWRKLRSALNSKRFEKADA